MPNEPAEQMPVNIHVKTVVGDETVQIAAKGRAYQKAGSFYLQYQESVDGSITDTIVKFSGDRALILRSGAIKMRLPLRMDAEMHGTYQTAYGVLETVTKAIGMDHSRYENKGTVELHYHLTVQGADAGTYHLKISYEEERN